MNTIAIDCCKCYLSDWVKRKGEQQWRQKNETTIDQRNFLNPTLEMGELRWFVKHFIWRNKKKPGERTNLRQANNHTRKKTHAWNLWQKKLCLCCFALVIIISMWNCTPFTNCHATKTVEFYCNEFEKKRCVCSMCICSLFSFDSRSLVYLFMFFFSLFRIY